MRRYRPRPVLAVKQNEARFQAQLVREAKLLGWEPYHTYDSTNSVAGFPDLVLVRDADLIFAELKRVGERPDPQQQAWLTRLSRVRRVQTFLWDPLDADWIDAVLGAVPQVSLFLPESYR